MQAITMSNPPLGPTISLADPSQRDGVISAGTTVTVVFSNAKVGDWIGIYPVDYPFDKGRRKSVKEHQSDLRCETADFFIFELLYAIFWNWNLTYL